MTEFQKYIVLTVPHNGPKYDKDNSGHFQDSKALEALKTLKSIMNDNRIKTETFINYRVERWRCDLNREPCNEEGFRPNLRTFLEKNEDEIFMLIDVHSFPSHEDRKEDVYFLVEINEKEKDLNTKKALKRGKDIALSMKNNIERAGFACSVFEAKPKENDIIQETIYRNKIPSILIEFNENLQVKQLNEIADVITFNLIQENTKIRIGKSISSQNVYLKQIRKNTWNLQFENSDFYCFHTYTNVQMIISYIQKKSPKESLCYYCENKLN